MIAVELCAGAGGLARGFTASGIEIAVAVENDRHAAATYRANFPGTELIEEDIARISGADLLEKAGGQEASVDVLVAGLPCQGFSESNRRTRTRANPRNRLYEEVLRLLAEIEPRWFVIENVAGIATLESGRFLKEMIGDFTNAGFRVSHKVLNAGDFGVPQLRRRTFLIGTNTEHCFRFPEKMEAHRPTVRDAIGDLPELENGASEDESTYGDAWQNCSRYAQELRAEGRVAVTGNEVSRNCTRVLERYKYIGMGENWRAIPRELMKNYKNRSLCHTGIYYRLRWDEQAKVIGNFRKNMLIHPEQDRGLSIREAARLQSFQDSHEFRGPLNDRQQQVGNAVPPKLAQVVGDALVESQKV